VQFIPARFDDAKGQAKLVCLIRPYEGEALIGELDLHTADNMSPDLILVNRHIVTIMQFNLYA